MRSLYVYGKTKQTKNMLVPLQKGNRAQQTGKKAHWLELVNVHLYTQAGISYTKK